MSFVFPDTWWDITRDLGRNREIFYLYFSVLYCVVFRCLESVDHYSPVSSLQMSGGPVWSKVSVFPPDVAKATSSLSQTTWMGVIFCSSYFYVYSAQNQRCNLCGRRRQNLSQGPAPDDIHERGSPTSVCSHKTLNTTPIGPSDPAVPELSPVWSMTSPAAKTHCQNTTSSTGSWTMGKFGGIRENLNLCVTQLWHWEPHKFLSCSGSLFVSSPAGFWVLIYN